MSHQLMLRAGMIRKMSSGVYNYMPFGIKVIKKIEEIVRGEMDRGRCTRVFSISFTSLRTINRIWKMECFWGRIV